MTKVTFAKRLQELLDIKNIKASDLSKATGISRSSISHYLKGDWEAKQDNIIIIADKYNVSEAWLMGYDVNIKKEIAEEPLSDFEKEFIELLRLIPQDSQPLVLSMIKAALKSHNLL